MSNQTRQLQNYALNQPINFQNPNPIIANRAPNTADKAPLGTIWIFRTSNTVYVLTSIANNLANWVLLTTSAGPGIFSSLLVTPGPTSLTGQFTVIAGTNAVSIGADAADHATTLGSVTGVSTTTIQGGTGGILLTPAVTGPITIGTAAMTATITLGLSTAVAGQIINIGNSAAPNTVNIGSLTGAAETSISAGTGGILLNAVAGNIEVNPAVAAPVASPTATVVSNSRVGYATFTCFTTAAAGSQAFTVTNALVTTASVLLVSIANGGANDAQMTITRVTKNAGSFVVSTQNFGAAALNGDVTITWWVMAN